MNFPKILASLGLIIVTLCGLPAVATGLECSSANTTPTSEYVEFAAGRHPEFSGDQLVSIARLYEVALLHHEIATSATASATERAFAERMRDSVMSMIAINDHFHQHRAEVKNILQAMEDEKASGLVRISDELEPEVRSMAQEGIAILMVMFDITREMRAILIERAIEEMSARYPLPSALPETDRMLCFARREFEVLAGVGRDLWPGLFFLAYSSGYEY